MQLIRQFYYFNQKNKLLKLIYNFLSKCIGKMIGNKPIPIEKKIKIYVPDYSLRGFMFLKYLFFKNAYEVNTTEIIKKLIKPGENFIDIGASVGYYSLLAAKKIGMKGRVYSFEPNEKVFNVLKRNIEINNFKNVIPINKAVSNFNGKKTFFLGNILGHSSFRSQVGGEKKEVQVVTLDNFFKHKKIRVDWIKIDVEGAEGFVVEGAKKIISKNKNIKIILEWSPKHLKEMGYKPLKLLHLLYNMNFKIFKITHKLEPIPKCKSKSLLKEDTINLFCMR